MIQSPPDLASLFALGVLSAGVVSASAARRSRPWAWLALGAATPVFATILVQGSVWTLDHLFWVDLALGPARDARPGAATDDRFRAGFRICLRDPVPAPTRLVLVNPALGGRGRAKMRRTAFSWGRLVGPAVVLAILVWRLGTSPFIAGLRTVNGGALAAAAGLAVLTTVCYAWRRKIVAGGLGLDLTAVVYGIMMLVASLPGAVAPVMAWFRRNRPPARAQPPLRGRTAHA